MKTIEEIAADILSQRERIEQHIRELAAAGSAEEILQKLHNLRSRSEGMAALAEPPGKADGERGHS